MLAFARQQPLRPHINDINKLIVGFEAVLQRARVESIDIELALSGVPIAADIDGPQLETALLNLVVNGRDAMPRGGRLRIATALETLSPERVRTMGAIPAGDYVVVEVRDTGDGMRPEILDKVFEPFFTTKEIGKGSGLGLSQVYGFVAQSGGHVEIDSTSARGTTVRV